MKTSDFYYDLPENLIAQYPLKNRSHSKLLVLNREKDTIEHRTFTDIIGYLNSGDTLVLNNTKVLPARIYGNRIGREEKIEFLLLNSINKDTWESLVRPGKKARVGTKLEFGNGLLKGEVLSIKEDGTRVIKFIYTGIFEEILDRLGEMPLPPYIKARLEDKDRYQTVYSKYKGSAAAPTAGLHFTDSLLADVRKKGVNIAFITLHVGLGTFRPVKVENIKEHHMHSEYFQVTEENARVLNETRRKNGKVVAVGTTTARTLETIADIDGFVKAQSGWTDIFIYPGYNFKAVDGLLTNFHLPESTLLMLVSAFSTREKILNAYQIAIENQYRFFSFGDAMLII